MGRTHTNFSPNITYYTIIPVYLLLNFTIMPDDKKLQQYKAASTKGAGTKATGKTAQGLPANKDGYPTKVQGLSKAIERGRSQGKDTVMVQDSKGVARPYTTGQTKIATLPAKATPVAPKTRVSSISMTPSGTPSPVAAKTTQSKVVTAKAPEGSNKRLVTITQKTPVRVNPNSIATQLGSLISPKSYNQNKTMKIKTKTINFPKKK